MNTGSRSELEVRQAQKLESLGRVAASVAHDINTQVQVVSDSLHLARDAMSALAAVLEQYRLLLAAASPEVRGAITRAEAAADVPAVFDSTSRMAEGALEALGRVTTVIRAMADFAQSDQPEMRWTDVNRAIRATLTVARGEYKYVADLALELEDIPPVSCFAGDVRHAVLNLVANAARAIADAAKGQNVKGLITVRTRQDGEDVVIAVTDTGPGALDRVGDAARRLAIARAIVVDEHGGALTVEATPGGGTTVSMRFPIGGRDPALATT